MRQPLQGSNLYAPAVTHAHPGARLSTVGAPSLPLPSNGLPMPVSPLRRAPLRTACLSLAACLLAACAPTPTPADDATRAAPARARLEILPEPSDAQARAMGLAGAVKRVHFRDRHGEGLLLLDRHDRQETDPDAPEDTLDVAVLTATLLGRTDGAAFQPRWAREIRVPCPGLDLDAGWFLDQVGATDLDGDGQAEITLASHTFCGGGVDPQDIRITLLDGAQHYTIKGESLVSIEGEAPFGGERQDEAALATAPAAFRRHLDAVWEAVRVLPALESEGAP